MPFLKNIPVTNAPDEELVQSYRSTGKLDILSELYQRYMELVYGVCLKYLKEPGDAQDAVLNIFEELISKLLKHEVNNFKGWLYQLSKNHCLMLLRSEQKFKKVQIDVSLMQNDETVHLNGELDKEDNFKHLNYCLGQLIAEQKNVLELFYLEGKSYNEIVTVTGIEWNAVRSFIQNGRRNLKICMDKQMDQ
ncbi:sigma-70 family RNA polymerase sigma factor [soil metagenome]